MIFLTTFWVLMYASHPNRGYLLKDPPNVITQFETKKACESAPFYLAITRFKACIEVKSASCYNEGSVCKFDPVNGVDAEILSQMVPWPE